MFQTIRSSGRRFRSVRRANTPFEKRTLRNRHLRGAVLRLLPSFSFADSSYTPSVLATSSATLRTALVSGLNPFSGEGAFHTGVDVASDYGAPVHATADGVVTIVENHAGYGRLVVVDHGSASPLGTRTCPPLPRLPAHASSAASHRLLRHQRSLTGPHVSYEVRMTTLRSILGVIMNPLQPATQPRLTREPAIVQGGHVRVPSVMPKP